MNVNSLSDCSQFEFSCSMGLCINSYMKCDGRYDCPDNSDELNCGKYVFIIACSQLFDIFVIFYKEAY